jgi:hypothetical protein
LLLFALKQIRKFGMQNEYDRKQIEANRSKVKQVEANEYDMKRIEAKQI